MKLRNQLLTLSLATLLVPWSGWMLVKELEQFLRADQENALLATARTVAQALPAEFRLELQYERGQVLPLRRFDSEPVLDGYPDDWPEAGSALTFMSDDKRLRLRLLGGQYQGQIYLFCRVYDSTSRRQSAPEPMSQNGIERADGIELFLRSARGLVHFRVQTAAPGPLLLSSQSNNAGQLAAYWLDRSDGYDVELALPPSGDTPDISLGAVDVLPNHNGVREAGTLHRGRPAHWLSPAAMRPALSQWLAGVIPAGSRAWVVDANGWVTADTGPGRSTAARRLSWAERVLYRIVADSRPQIREPRPERLVRFEDTLVLQALKGGTGQRWEQSLDDAAVTNLVAVPVNIQQQVRGAVVIEASNDGLLLITNRALARLLVTTLLLTFGLTAGLWFFATHLSRRVQRLSGAVSEAMDDAAHPRELPLTSDRDELGALARNNARLLRAVADYTSYLQKLAGRLSHELKTPLAITRSSLDNLASQDLDADADRYVQRAREGLDRQDAIVRAMSEASRLESAVRAAEWADIDLENLLQRCVEGYRSLYRGRDIQLRLSGQPRMLHCAPDLLAQALDKLVDNAVSLTGPQDVITVGLDVRERACHITVTNTGSRLPDVLQEQLFDSLVSLRENGAAGRHLGLGLHIVRLVAEAHGGRVQASNLPDAGGVAFTIILPDPG